MSEAIIRNRQYTVHVHKPENANGALVFTFFPKHFPAEYGTGRVPQFTVMAYEDADRGALDWSGSPDVPDAAARDEIEAEIRNRLAERENWINRVQGLVDQVEAWTREMDWSTRRIEKKLEDARIGTHRVPALLMQRETFRVLLEPLGRSAPGVEGVVDLYLMPAYDDIVRLCDDGGQWIIYSMPGAAVREVEAAPLSKETLEKVLAEMVQNAA